VLFVGLLQVVFIALYNVFGLCGGKQGETILLTGRWQKNQQFKNRNTEACY